MEAQNIERDTSVFSKFIEQEHEKLVKEGALPERTKRDRFDYLVNVYRNRPDALGKDILITGSSSENNWENMYLATRLINSCKGKIRIVTDNLFRTVYANVIVLAHLNKWLEIEGNTLDILIKDDDKYHKSLFYKDLEDFIKEEKVRIKKLSSLEEPLEVKGALFGETGFKFSNEHRDIPVYLGNFDSLEIVKKLSEQFDQVFSAQTPLVEAIEKVKESTWASLMSGLFSKENLKHKEISVAAPHGSETDAVKSFYEELNSSILGAQSRGIITQANLDDSVYPVSIAS